ncbi:MAG TPA: adenylate/guanylate cyclase domain-containing protein [Alphaproteobacteria bacterium]|nr:adenylate/guanylate cyclase domain-containing protein [Alphaproteobacteria bacterium]
MDFAKFNELLLQSIGVGLAVVDPSSLRILFHNQRLAQWFPAIAEQPETLDVLIPKLDREKLRARLAGGRPFALNVDTRSGSRTLSFAVQITEHRSGGMNVLMVEWQNVSKIRELEYMIESYSKMIEKQNRELKKEKDRVEKVLLNIMPKTVYEEWRRFGVTTPQRYDSASVLMLDFVGFTEMAISEDPPALIAELNDIFTAFDRIVDQFGCERMKTIGDAYIAVSGIPETTPDHAQNIAAVALRFVRFLEKRNRTHQYKWECRIGINSGPVIGSIVGVQKYVYDIFGPGVNLAARMEALAAPMEIRLCDSMYALLPREYECIELGPVEVKGFGTRTIYRLVGGPDLED